MKTLAKHLAGIAVVAALIAGGSALAASASDNWENHCTRCHGADGKGQTKVGKKLQVRDMTSDEYKQKLDDTKAVASLKEGIKKDGKEIKKSFASELSDAEIKELVGYVRKLK